MLPPKSGPDEGSGTKTLGGAAEYARGWVAKPSDSTTTETSFTPAVAAGTTHRISVELDDVGVTMTEPKRTSGELPKLVPLIVIVFPPPRSPELGTMLEISGSGVVPGAM